jgi:hypothetical protein
MHDVAMLLCLQLIQQFQQESDLLAGAICYLLCMTSINALLRVSTPGPVFADTQYTGMPLAALSASAAWLPPSLTSSILLPTIRAFFCSSAEEYCCTSVCRCTSHVNQRDCVQVSHQDLPRTRKQIQKAQCIHLYVCKLLQGRRSGVLA